MASPCSSNLPHNNRFQLMGRMASNSSYRFPAAASKIRGDIKRSSHFEPNNAHPPPNMRPKLGIERLLRLLRLSPRGGVFNPWWQSDTENDIGLQAPGIRRHQLRAYLFERIGTAELALVGEALGYRGDHFTGIAMTSERILLKGGAGAARCKVFSTIKPRRTSKPEKTPHGFSEPTASIVWSALLRLGIAADQFVLWNAFPWHSFNARAGMLSNRVPTKAELAAGTPTLRAFIDLFPAVRFVAVGRVAASQLPSASSVRHPSSGGAALFRQQIASLLSGLS